MRELNPNLDVYGDDIPLWEKGQHGGRTRPINQDTLFNITKEVCEVFRDLEIKWCLSHGTALGIYRDGDTIPWDDDVDIAIFTKDHDKLAEARRILRDKGFYVPNEGNPNVPIDPKSNMPWYDFVAIKGGEKIECWKFDKREHFYVYDANREGLAIPRKFMDELDTFTWRGINFFIPNHIEEYLTWMYGSSWNKPDPNKKYNNNREK